jgi:hypothetical protein
MNLWRGLGYAILPALALWALIAYTVWRLV